MLALKNATIYNVINHSGLYKFKSLTIWFGATCMFKEIMTPKERFDSLYRTGRADRPGVGTFSVAWVAKMAGLSPGICFQHPVKMAHSYIAVQKLFGFDNGPHFGHLASGAAEFGGRLRYPDMDSRNPYPVIIERPVNSPEDVDRLEIPDPRKAGEIPEQIQGIRYVLNEYPEGYRNPSIITGDPFTRAASVVGIESILMWITAEPKLVDALLKKVVDFSIEEINYIVRTVGPIDFFDAGTSDSNDLITPQQFEKYALPAFQMYRRGAIKVGAERFIAHPCGNQIKNLDYWASIPGTYAFNFDFRTPLPLCIQKLAASSMIMGNIEPDQFVYGNYTSIQKSSKRLLSLAADNCPHGFVLGPGCEMPYDAVPVNVFSMIESAREYAEAKSWNAKS
jgi:uroporphyrinogen decarboxylase